MKAVKTSKLRFIFEKYQIMSAAFVCLFGVSIFFFFSSTISDFLGRYLQVLPSYTGGEICADFMDSSSDDYGAGNLQYPSNAKFKEGSLDLIRYTVHQPVINAKWQDSPDYWQLVLEYKSGPSLVRNILVYISLTDLSEMAGTEPLFDSAENVAFDAAHPWDFAVWICDGQGKVFNNKKKVLCTTETYLLDEERTVKIRIPLENEELQKVYGAEKTYHYVLTGAFSLFDRGGFMPIEKRRSISHGGLFNPKEYNSLIPKVYDILGDNGALGTWNPESLQKAQVSPVEVNMHSAKRGRTVDDETKAYIQKVKDLYAESFAGAASPDFSDIESTLQHYEDVMNQNPDDYVSMAYYGSSLAVKGGNSSVVQAVALVHKAYEYLDKAAGLAYDKDGEIDVLMNRGSVSNSVPEGVFGKSLSGAQDFMRIVSLTDDEKLKAYCYVMAYECYKKCGKDTQAMLALQESKKLVE